MLTRSSLTIRLHPNDDVVIARAQLVGGTQLLDEKITVCGLVPPGAQGRDARDRRASRCGATTRSSASRAATSRRASTCTSTTSRWAATFERDYAFGADIKPTQYATPPATFDGIVRADGRVATRNYIGILSTVNCSATVVARHRRPFHARAARRTSRTSTAWSR